MCLRTVLGVRGGDSVCVAVSTPTDIVQEGNSQDTALGKPGTRQRAMHL